MNVDFHELATLNHAETLHDVQLLAVRSLKTVDERFAIEADGIDHERVPFVMADRLSEPRRLDARRMLVGEIDVTNLVIGLPDHKNLARRLHEEEGMNAVQI